MSREEALRRLRDGHASALDAVQYRAIVGRMLGGVARVPPNHSVADARRQRAVADLLVEAGLATAAPARGFWEIAVDAAIATIAPRPVDLVALWDAAFVLNNAVTHEPYVFAFNGPTSLSLGGVRALLDAGDAVEWYTCDAGAALYGPVESLRASRVGPLPAGDLGGAVGRSGVGMSAAVAVSSAQLRRHVEFRVRAVRLEQLWAGSLPRWLRESGILAADEAEAFGSDFRGVVVALPDDAAQWAANFERRLRDAAAQLDRMRTTLLTIGKVRRAVDDRGGWAAFLAEYRSAVAAFADAPTPAAVPAPGPGHNPYADPWSGVSGGSGWVRADQWRLPAHFSSWGWGAAPTAVRTTAVEDD